MKIFKKFLIAFLILGLLGGFAYGVLMFANKTPGGPVEDVKKKTADFTLDGVAYTVSRGTTWSEFIEKVNGDEETEDLLSVAYTGAVCFVDHTTFVKGETQYARTTNVIRDGDTYSFVTPSEISYSIAAAVPTDPAEICTALDCMTWSDLLCEENEQYVHSSRLFEAGGRLCVQGEYFTLLELNAQEVLLNDFIMKDACYTLGGGISNVTFSFENNDYPFMIGQTFGEWYDTIGKRCPVSFYEHGPYIMAASGLPYKSSHDAFYLSLNSKLYDGMYCQSVSGPESYMIEYYVFDQHLVFEDQFTLDSLFWKVCERIAPSKETFWLNDDNLVCYSEAGYAVHDANGNQATGDTLLYPGVIFYVYIPESEETVVFSVDGKLYQASRDQTFGELVADGGVLSDSYTLYGLDYIADLHMFPLGVDMNEKPVHGASYNVQDPRFGTFVYRNGGADEVNIVRLGLSWASLLMLGDTEPDLPVEWIEELYDFTTGEEYKLVTADGKEVWLNGKPVYVYDLVVNGGTYIPTRVSGEPPVEDPDEPEEPVPTTFDFSLDDKTYRVPIGTTWKMFEEQLNADEATADMLDIVFAGAVASGDMVRFVKNGSVYVRADDPIHPNVQYALVACESITFSFETLDGTDEAYTVKNFMTWADLLCEKNIYYSHPSEIFEASGRLLVQGESITSLLIDGQAEEVLLDDFIVGGVRYVQGGIVSTVSFSFANNNYPFIPGQTFGEWYDTIGKRSGAGFVEHAGYVMTFGEPGLPYMESYNGVELRLDTVLQDDMYTTLLAGAETVPVFYHLFDEKNSFDIQFTTDAVGDLLFDLGPKSDGFWIDQENGDIRFGAAGAYVVDSAGNAITVNTKFYPTMELYVLTPENEETVYFMVDGILYQADQDVEFGSLVRSMLTDYSVFGSEYVADSHGQTLGVLASDSPVHGAKYNAQAPSIGSFTYRTAEGDKVTSVRLGIRWYDLLQIGDGALDWIEELYDMCEGSRGKLMTTDGKEVWLNGKPVSVYDCVVDKGLYIPTTVVS